MGTWGVGIFSDDLAADIRDEYRDDVGDGLSGPEATDRLLRAHAEELADDETAPIVWLALAAAQARVGRLEERVRDRAIVIIDAGGDLARWSDAPRQAARRRAVLARLREELTGPPRPPRRIPRPKRSVWPWEPGSVVAFRRTDGRWLLLRVVATQGRHGVGGGRLGIVEVLDWIGDSVPTRARVSGLRPARPTDWTATSGHSTLVGVSVLNQRQLDRFTAVIEASEAGHWAPYTLIGTEQLEWLAETRFGLT